MEDTAELLQKIQQMLGKHLCLNENAPLEQSLEMLLQRLEGITAHMVRLTYFFPEYTKLKPVETYGPLPSVGDEVFVRGFRLHSPPDQRYNAWMGPWIVKKRYVSVSVTTDRIEALRMCINGAPPNPSRVEVHLHKARRWRDAYPCPADKELDPREDTEDAP